MDGLSAEEDAALVIETEAGAHFDPAMAEVFLQLVRADRIHVEGRHGTRPDRDDRLVFDPRILSRAVYDAAVD